MLDNNQIQNTESTNCSEANCAGCQAAREQAAKSEEISFAFLLALVPALTLSLFSSIGLL